MALAQANSVADAIEAAHRISVDIVTVATTGDRVQDRPLAEIGGKALWTKELDRALVSGDVDFCVHSMKDVESDRPDIFTLAAMLPRADVRDRLIGAPSIDALPQGARVGTSSPRRAAQLKRLRPDLAIEVLRGNVETRLKRVADGDVDATLLAAAGLDRLGIAAGSPISVEVMLPAPGQAAIGIECRAGDESVRAMLHAIGDGATFSCVFAERDFTRALGATCASPVAALATIDGNAISLAVEILSADGAAVMREHIRCAPGDEAAPADLARTMLSGAPQSISSLFEVL